MKNARPNTPLAQIAQAPLFRVALCLMIGVVAFDQLGAAAWWVLVVVAPLLGTAWLFRSKKTVWMSASLYVLLIGAGAGVQMALTESKGSGLAPIDCTEARLIGWVAESPRKTAKGQKVMVNVMAYVDTTGKQVAVNERILVYLKPEMSVARYDSIHLRADLRDVWSQHEGYLAYLHRMGVRYAAYAEAVVRAGQHHDFSTQMEQFQAKMSDQLAATMPGDTTAAGIARAMFLGDTDHLDRDLRRSFADAGLSHVLAISGMHISIMFLMLNWLLGFLPLHIRARNYLMLTILLVYMLLTGASPSVVRAVVVAGALIVAQLAYLRTRALNLLGAAAIVQLLWEPAVIYQLGFQLSYAAVAGILLLYPLYERAAATSNRILRHVHEGAGVTLAAQAFTTPIILAVFGKFPAYFLLANMSVAVLGTVTTFAGFVALLVSWIPGVAGVAGWICAQLLNILAVVATWFAELPYAVLSADNLSLQGIAIVAMQGLAVVALVLIPRAFRKGKEQVMPAPTMA